MHKSIYFPKRIYLCSSLQLLPGIRSLLLEKQRSQFLPCIIILCAVSPAFVCVLLSDIEVYISFCSVFSPKNSVFLTSVIYVIFHFFMCSPFLFQRKNSVPVKEEVIIEVDEPPKKKRKEYGTIKNDCPARMSIRTIKVRVFLSFFLLLAR